MRQVLSGLGKPSDDGFLFVCNSYVTSGHKMTVSHLRWLFVQLSCRLFSVLQKLGL